MTINESFKIPVLYAVDHGKAYILDGPKSVIHIYPLDNTTPHYTICKPGEGPGELQFVSFLSLWNDQVVVSGNSKLIIFDGGGHSLTEKKIPFAHDRFIPVGDHFICRTLENSPGKSIVSATLYNANLTSPKKLEEFTIDRSTAKNKNGKVDYYFCKDYFSFYATNQTIIVGNTQKGFYFAIYDSSGNKIRDINGDYKKRPITEEQKEAQLEIWKKDYGPIFYEKLLKRSNLVFPKFYPAYERFTAHKDKLYIRLHPIKDQCQELLVLDTKGKELTRHKVPAASTLSEICVWNSHYYYLQENPDKETWELHAASLI